MISWPDYQEQQDISVQFQLQSQLPGVIGALDRTHIRLFGAIGGDANYINRKGFPSVQLQVCIDYTLLLPEQGLLVNTLIHFLLMIFFLYLWRFPFSFIFAIHVYPSLLFIHIVSDNRMLIRQVFTGWAGSTHDARVLRNS